MKQIATTIEQSERLLSIGVSSDTADMCHIFYDVEGEQIIKDEYDELQSENGAGSQYLVPKDYGEFDWSYRDDCPAWSLPALLELLPKHLESFHFSKWYEPFQDSWEICDKDTEITISGEVQLYFSDGKWIVDYDWYGFAGRLPQSENPIEAVILAMELLHANGYSYQERRG